MPCRRILPQYNHISNTSYTYDIGLEFAGVTYPDTSIKGHRFMLSKRDSRNKTVLDKGILTKSASANGTSPTFVTFKGGNTNNTGTDNASVGFFTSPKTLNDRTALSGTYLKFEGLYSSILTEASTAADPITIDGDPFTVNTSGDLYGAHSVPSVTNIVIDHEFYIEGFSDPTNTALGVKIVSNGDFPAGSVTTTLINHGVVAMQLAAEIPVTTFEADLYVVSEKLYNSKAYADLETIIYLPLHSGYKTLTSSQQTFGGDSFITQMNINSANTWFSVLSSKGVSWDYVADLFVESEINLSLRFNDDAVRCNSFLQRSADAATHNKTHSIVESIDSTIDTYISFCREYVEYNKDQNKLYNEKPNVSLDSTYDYCSSCLFDFSYRIAYSEKSFQEENLDNYKNIKALNYYDLDGSTGILTDLVVNNDNLYAIATNATYFVPTRPQNITTNESNIFIGTGDVLSIPPKRIISPDFAYGGSQDKFTVASSPAGVFFVDRKSYKIFLLTKQLKDVTPGMANWFRNNLDFKLEDAFQKLGLVYPAGSQSTAGTNSIGLQGIYDPYERRYILHKRDFLPIDFQGTFSAANPIATVGDGTYYDTDTNIWYFSSTAAGTFTVISEFDVTYFENHSWTISYSLDHQGWWSYHSYQPKFMFNDHKTFYSQSHSSFSLYEHNKGYFQNFYETKYDHIIEYIIADSIFSRTYNSLELIHDVKLEVNNYFEDVLEVTFDRLWAYNDNQSTGLQTITPKKDQTIENIWGNVFQVDDSTISAERTDREWHLNELRDNSISTSIVSKQWSDIQTGFYIDKVSNPLGVDLTQSKFQIARLRSEWLAVRLYFNPRLNYKSILQYSKMLTKHSNRS